MGAIIQSYISKASLIELGSFAALGALGIASKWLQKANAADYQWLGRRFLLEGAAQRAVMEPNLERFLEKTRGVKKLEYARNQPKYALAYGHGIDTLQKICAVAAWHLSGWVVPNPKLMHLIPASRTITSLFTKAIKTPIGVEVVKVASAAAGLRHVVNVLPLALKAANLALEAASIHTKGENQRIEQLRVLTERWGNRAEGLFFFYSGMVALTGMSIAAIACTFAVSALAMALFRNGLPKLGMGHVEGALGLIPFVGMAKLSAVHKWVATHLISPRRILGLANFLAAYEAWNKKTCQGNFPLLIATLKHAEELKVEINDPSRAALHRFVAGIQDMIRKETITEADGKYIYEMLAKKGILTYTQDLPKLLQGKTPQEARKALSEFETNFLHPLIVQGVLQPNQMALFNLQVEIYDTIQNLLLVEQEPDDKKRQEGRLALHQSLQERGLLKDENGEEKAESQDMMSRLQQQHAPQHFTIKPLAEGHPAFADFKEAERANLPKDDTKAYFNFIMQFLEEENRYGPLLAYMRESFEVLLQAEFTILNDQALPLDLLGKRRACKRLAEWNSSLQTWLALEKKLCGINEKRMRESDGREGAVHKPLLKELRFPQYIQGLFPYVDQAKKILEAEAREAQPPPPNPPPAPPPAAVPPVAAPPALHPMPPPVVEIDDAEAERLAAELAAAKKKK